MSTSLSNQLTFEKVDEEDGIKSSMRESEHCKNEENDDEVHAV